MLKLSVILAIIVTAFAEDVYDPTVRAKLLVACGNETGFDLLNWNQLEERHFDEPIPYAFKCFINCVYEKHGVTRQGEVTPIDEVNVHLSLDMAQWQNEYEMLKRCGDETVNDLSKPCERGFNIFKCTHRGNGANRAATNEHEKHGQVNYVVKIND